MHRAKIVLYGLVMLSLLAACGGPTATPTPTPAAIPSQTPPPTSTVTPTLTTPPTLTPTLTLTPSQTPRPTYTALPVRTATPANFFSSTGLAFSFTYPQGWVLDSSKADGLYLTSPLKDVIWSGSSYVEDKQTPLEDVIATFTEADSNVLPGGQVDSKSEIMLADKTRAQLVVISGHYSNGAPILLHLIYARKGLRTYLFFSYGPTSSINTRKSVLNDMYASISLHGEALYGLERAQTLVMLGSELSEKDFDPARCDGSAADFVGMLYSGLVSLTPQLQIAPDLAESWTTNAEGTLFTFNLRKDLVFENGKPLTAQDVKASWERAADPATASGTAATYLGDIVGVKEKLAGKAKEISGVKVIDERTLEVTLDGPKPYFLAKLTYPTAFVIDPANLEASPKRWMFTPNASGPFKLREYREDEAVVFERNAAYHTPPQVQYLVFRLYQSGTSQSFYEAGEIDIAYLGSATAKTLIDTNSPLVKELLHTPALCTSFLAFDNTQAPFDDVNVRKAFALATDSQRLMEVTTQGTAILAKSILPPGMPGYAPDVNGAVFNAAEAKKALAASKYAASMPKIIFSKSGYANRKDDYADALVNMWRQSLGVTVEVRYLDPQDYIKASREQHGQIALGSWCADYPDPENFLDVLFHSGSQFNYAAYSHPLVDALEDQARVEQDGARRLSLYQQIERTLLGDYAAVPISHSQTYVLVKPAVKGFIVAPMGVRILNLVSLK